MKKQMWLMLLFVWVCSGAAACSPDESGPLPGGSGTVQTPGSGSDDETQTPADPDDPNDSDTPGENENDDQNPQNMKINVTVGGRTYTATLEDNAAARAFLGLLPLELDMTELNGNEKYADLPQSLPTATFRPGTIRTGDLLLWGSSTVVLFYETFSSSYSYTRLGRLDDPSGLAAAVGGGSARVTFAR